MNEATKMVESRAVERQEEREQRLREKLGGWGICGNCANLSLETKGCEDPEAIGCSHFVPTKEFAEELAQRRDRRERSVATANQGLQEARDNRLFGRS